MLRGRLLLTRDSFCSFRTRLLGAWAELLGPCKKDRLEHSLAGNVPKTLCWFWCCCSQPCIGLSSIFLLLWVMSEQGMVDVIPDALRADSLMNDAFHRTTLWQGMVASPASNSNLRRFSVVVYIWVFGQRSYCI